MQKRSVWTLVLAGVAAGAAAVYRYRRQLLGRVMGLPPVADKVFVLRDQRVAMPDEITLATDIYLPAQHLTDNPTILIRTPYGKRSWVGWIAPFFAERGYAVVVQDVRGRFGSEGDFVPRFNEAEDGLATLTWIERQLWSNGRVGTFGQSYLGMVQWAVAIHNPPQLQAMVPAVTTARGPNLFYPYGIFALEFTARWLAQVNAMSALPNTQPLSTRQALPLQIPSLMDRGLPDDTWDHLPLETLDEKLVGTAVSFFQKYLNHPPSDDFWQPVSYFNHLENVTAPVHLISGWYDFMLGDLLADYERLVELGRPPHLTIGHWHHFDMTSVQTMMQIGLAWFDAHLRDNPAALPDSPVRLWLMGADKWLAFDRWPPPAEQQTWYLQKGDSATSDGRLSLAPPTADSPPATYIYNPANPTPNLGGAAYTPQPGPQDQRPLEARPDVLTFTSAPLTAEVDLVGPVRAVLYVHTTAPETDFVARLCVVDADGRSLNLCDGITRVAPAGDATRIDIDLWATAYRCRRGQQLRLHVCSAAHPRWARHTGTTAPLATATDLQSSQQTIFLDAERSSCLWLPCLSPPQT